MGAGRIATSIAYWLLKFWKGLKTHAGITAVCLIVYCAAITYYFYICATVKMDFVEFIWFKDKWRNTILGLGTANIFVFFAIGIKSSMQRNFLMAYFASITGTYLIVMAVYFHWLMFPYQDLWVLDGGIGLITIAIIINAIRHDMLD